MIASMQGIHCTSDAPWVPQRLGEARAREGAYVWRKLIDSGVVIVNGTEIIRDGEHTDALPGTIFRSGRDTDTVEVPGGRSA